MATTLVHVGVRATDLQATIRFWRDGLGGKIPVDIHNIRAGAFKVEDPDGITVDVTASHDQWPGVRPGQD